MDIQPIFVFSISRSGSTLLQRIIAAHPGVATVAEPWLLLPYAYTRRPRGVDAEYYHPLLVEAIESFCSQLPRGSSDYEAELRDFVLRLYRKAAGPDASHFVDKSPPYCLIAQEIIRLFPEGKFVFLWRSPLSIISSVMQTWDSMRWQPTFNRGDLFVGLPRLVDAYRANGEVSHSIRFEDVVAGDRAPLLALMEYLGVEFDPGAIERFSQVSLNGPMGDPTGVKRYAALSTEPQHKWKGSLANPLRRTWCKRYLRYLGSERLGVMGYDSAQLMRELDAQPLTMSSLIPDLGRLIVDVAKEPIRIRTRGKAMGGPNVIRELLRA